MKKNTIDAFYEVYQIINLLDEALYKKIPNQVIEKFRKIAEKSTSNKVILPYISIEEQNILYESKVLLKFIEMYIV